MEKSIDGTVEHGAVSNRKYTMILISEGVLDLGS